MNDWLPLPGVSLAADELPIRASYGEDPILIFRTGLTYRGVQSNCPHTDLSLVGASLLGGGQLLRCYFHSYTFRLADGRGVNCPGYSIAVYDIKEEDGVAYARPAAR